MMLPLLSPVRTSPFWLKATQVTYLGLSLLSKTPIRLYNIPPLSKDQNDTCPFPQETIWFRSNGCHSAQTTMSTEHCNRQSLTVKWPASGQNIREPWLFAILWTEVCGGIFYRVVTMRIELLHVCVPSFPSLWCHGRSSASPRSIYYDRRSRRWRTGSYRRQPWKTTDSKSTRRIRHCRSRWELSGSQSSIF